MNRIEKSYNTDSVAAGSRMLHASNAHVVCHAYFGNVEVRRNLDVDSRRRVVGSYH